LLVLPDLQAHGCSQAVGQIIFLFFLFTSSSFKKIKNNIIGSPVGTF
jgi:hypothetical protein